MVSLFRQCLKELSVSLLVVHTFQQYQKLAPVSSQVGQEGNLFHSFSSKELVGD